MYVSLLDRPWVETRYLFQGFHASSVEDIQELRRHCEHVYVDPERGCAAVQSLKTLTPTGADELTRILSRTSGEARYPIQTSIKEELQACRESRAYTLDVITNILDELQASRHVSVVAVRQAVKGMVASILRNPDAFFWLTRLKDKDSYAYAHCTRLGGSEGFDMQLKDL